MQCQLQLLFPLIINISVPNPSTPCNPLCFSAFTVFHGVITIKKKKKIAYSRTIMSDKYDSITEQKTSDFQLLCNKLIIHNCFE